MRRILVTGADGLLGSNLVRELIERDYAVRAFLHPQRQTQTLRGLDIEVCYGDLLDAKSVNHAVMDCDAVIHAGALTTVWPARSALVNSVNIRGTQNVIDAVRRHRVKRMVYVGSASSFGFGPKHKPGTESSSFVSHKYGLDYIDSKYKAQDLVLGEIADGLPCVIVNPTFMFGAYDSLHGPASMILAVAHGKLPGCTSGGRNFICVRDVAKGVANALTMGRIGECYILGNENLSYGEIFSKIARVTGVAAPWVPLNRPLMYTFGWAGETIARIRRTKPTVTLPMARISCDGQYYSPEKARTELLLPQTPIETGIEQAFGWMKRNGHVKQEAARFTLTASLDWLRRSVEWLTNVTASRGVY